MVMSSQNRPYSVSDIGTSTPVFSQQISYLKASNNP